MMSARRETFGSRLGLVMTMTGVAVGLGNVWRFPYMTGTFGGAPFVLFYLLVVVLIGVPALMAEWALGRATRRGPAGAFARAGLPGGRLVGWTFFAVVVAATGYYSNAIGWVLHYAIGELLRPFQPDWPRAAVLPPASGFDAASLLRQLAMTGTVILACVAVLLRGLRAGIERASKVIMPMLAVSLGVLIVRGLTLPGAGAGVDWYLFKFELSALTPSVMVAALGQACFTLSLGGTFMVVYGSYLADDDDLGTNAALTAGGDLIAGLLAGLAILPAVFAFGLPPDSGPGLLFETLPQVFAALPFGWLFGLLFYLGLLGAAYLSAVAAFEVLVVAVTDNTRLSRKPAVWTLAATVFVCAVPPMINMRIFVPWDLTFGSGAQTLGALVAAITVGWTLDRQTALRQLETALPAARARWLYAWVRFAVPGAILTVGAWWLLHDVLGVADAG